MKIAFITEMADTGKVPVSHPNMRTEFAWMHALDAMHHNIYTYGSVKGYEHVFIIFPKGKTFLNSEGSKLVNATNPVSDLLRSDILEVLKHNNSNVYYVQEGPHWWFNDYELEDQINFYNLVSKCDAIFAHNESDTHYYKGIFTDSKVHVLPSLMIDNNIRNIVANTENKTIIGGNFARWYGGFESYMIARQFETPIYGQSSHATRAHEDQLIQQLPRVEWTEWMNQLSSFKYAVHMMSTVAAGTFSLNCAYFGIPCIGNKLVDTQRLCHPDLAVDVSDINAAKELAIKLRNDTEFYLYCSNVAKENYKIHYDINIWKSKINLE